MFILLFLLAYFLCVYEDNQSTTRNLKRTFQVVFLFQRRHAYMAFGGMKNGKKVTKSAIKMNIEYKICRNLAKISKFTYAKFFIFMHF